MSAIDPIRQWCAAHGFAFSYGNPNHVEVWMGETDVASSTDGVAVFSHLLTAEVWDGSHDTSYVGVWFAALVPFDFDNETIDATTERLKGYAKALLASIQQGNEYGWSGARFSYGYDDYAENVVWCCVRMTLTQLPALCVEQPPTPQPSQSYVMIEGLVTAMLDLFGSHGTELCPLAAVIDGTDTIVMVWLSSNEMANPSARINGVEIPPHLYNTIIVTDEVVQQMPELAQYAGWWVYSADQDNTGLPAGEYVQFDVYDGHQVLACGGIMPQEEESE